MGETTLISWCQHTHNHWIGCSKVSPACDGCYAEAMMDKRYGRVQWGGPGKGAGTRSLTSEANRKKPLAWNRKAVAAGTRPFVFCSSLADVFDNQVPVEWRADLFDLIRNTPQLVWLLLTKRPQMIIKQATEAGGLPCNAALGTTCEDQTRLNLNAPHLLRAKNELNPAFVFLSCEPLLGPLDMWLYLDPERFYRSRIDWVITGGETDQGGHKARPTNPQWFRDIRDQCAKARTPYHHKQNGEWASYDQIGGNGWEFTREFDGARYGRVTTGEFGLGKPMFDGRDFPTEYPWNNTEGVAWGPGPCMVKVGKGRTGRMLDGVTHDAFPAVA